MLPFFGKPEKNLNSLEKEKSDMRMVFANHAKTDNIRGIRQ